MNTIISLLNNCLKKLINEDKNIILLGEDIVDPYGGTFKVTKDISLLYPDNIYTTPISEACIMGIATGLSLSGFKPIIEIMFGDFITLIADQLINNTLKIQTMYGQNIKLPIVIRTPMGGRKGYGPTHSQTLEKLFFGYTNLYIIAISEFYDPSLLLEHSIQNINKPVLFIENKTIYTKTLNKISNETILYNNLLYPIQIINNDKSKVTIITYGGMASIVLDAVKQSNIICDVIIYYQISPLDITQIISYIKKTKKVIIVEETYMYFNWGAEVIAQINEQIQEYILCRRICAKTDIIPTAKILEYACLPQVENIILEIENIYNEKII